MDARRVGRFRVCRLLAGSQTDSCRNTAQLAGEVLPLPDAEIVQKVFAAHSAKCTARHGLPLPPQIVPEIQERHEIAVRVGKAGMFLTSSLLPIGGTLSRIRDRQRGRQDQHFAQAPFGIGLQDHPAQSRIDGQLCKAPPDFGDSARVVECTEFLK